MEVGRRASSANTTTHHNVIRLDGASFVQNIFWTHDRNC